MNAYHHSIYHDLGVDAAERTAAYRELFRYELESGEVDKIRKVINGNFALGSSRFQEEISNMLGRCVVPGRPRKEKDEKLKMKTWSVPGNALHQRRSIKDQAYGTAHLAGFYLLQCCS